MNLKVHEVPSSGRSQSTGHWRRVAEKPQYLLTLVLSIFPKHHLLPTATGDILAKQTFAMTQKHSIFALLCFQAGSLSYSTHIHLNPCIFI